MRPSSAKQGGFATGRSRASGNFVSKPKLKPKEQKQLEMAKTAEDQYALISSAVETLVEDEDDYAESVNDKYDRQFSRLLKKAQTDFHPVAIKEEMLRVLYLMILELLPVAKRNYLSSGKEQAAYALNTFIDQAKNLATDLNMSKDTEEQAQFITTRVIDPVLKGFATVLLSEIMDIQNEIDNLLPESPKRAAKIKARVSQAAKSLGKHLSESNTRMSLDISSYLAGNLR